MVTDPVGDIVPPVPADAVSVYVRTEKVALMVCTEVTLLNV